MASRTCSRTRRLGTTVIVVAAASLVSGCTKDDEGNVADLTPAHGAQGVTANLGGSEALDGAATPSVTLQDYVVQKGDTLSGLSTKFQIPVSAIKEANGMESDIIFYGKKIKIPVSESSPSNLASGSGEETLPVESPPTTRTVPTTTPAPKPETVEVKKTAEVKPSPIPPAPPSITPPAPAPNPAERRSLGAAFGGGDNGAPEPRMPSSEGVSPFYEQGTKGSTTPVPAVSGKPKTSTGESDVPLPRN